MKDTRRTLQIKVGATSFGIHSLKRTSTSFGDPRTKNTATFEILLRNRSDTKMKRGVKADYPESQVTPPKRPRTPSNRLKELQEERAKESLKSLDKSPAEQAVNGDSTSGPKSRRICEDELQNLPDLATPSDDDLYNLRLLASVCEDASNSA